MLYSKDVALIVSSSIQLFLELWCAFVSLCFAIVTYQSRKEEPKRYSLLFAMLLSNCLLLFSDAVALNFNGNTSILGYWGVRIGNFIVFSITSVLSIILCLYLIEILNLKNSKFSMRWVNMIIGISIVDLQLIIISQFTNFFYYFDMSNRYHRSSHYWICAGLAFLLITMFLPLVFLHRNSLSKTEFIALNCFIAFPLISNSFQFFHYGIALNNIAVTLSIMLIFLTDVLGKSKRLIAQNDLISDHEIALTQQKLRLSQLDNEMAELRIRVLLSQMQPHFIFNALGSIEQLCKIDPKKASESIHQFSRYLRNNLNALNTNQLIPFDQELSHIRSYVWLEKMRFDDDIFYHEDLQTTNFLLPALSIQPLIENSIKHGLLGKEEGALNVCLTTKETDQYYMITVDDDGCGFDDSIQIDTQEHVGLSNVIERIRLITDGKIEVNSIIDQGTTITIYLPKTA